MREGLLLSMAGFTGRFFTSATKLSRTQPLVGFKVQSRWCPILSEKAAGIAGLVIAVAIASEMLL